METENTRGLPEKLTFLRKQKRITQMELAEELNVSRQAISRWEVGAAVPSTDNLKVLSELYGVSVDYLLNDTAENISKQNKEKQDHLPAGEMKKETGLQCRKRFVVGVAIGLALLTISALIIIIISAANNSKQKTNQILPIEDLTVAEESDYTTYTFSFE